MMSIQNNNSSSASIKIESIYYTHNLFVGKCVLAMCHNYVNKYKYFMHHMLYYAAFIDACLLAALIYTGWQSLSRGLTGQLGSCDR